MTQFARTSETPWLDPVLLCAIAAVLGSLCAVAPQCTGFSTLLCGILISRSIRPAVLLWAVLLFGAGWLRAEYAIAQFERERVSVRDALHAPSRCAVSGTVTSSPSSRGTGDQLTLLWTAQLSRVDCEGRRLKADFAVRLYGGPRTLVRGASFEAIADLGALRLFRNLSTTDPIPAAARRSAVASGSVLSLEILATRNTLPAWIDRARAHVRSRIDATFHGSSRRMAKALVLGDNDFSLAESDSFARSGLAHLLAVSGSHLVFAVVSLVRGVESLLRRISGWSAHCDVGRWSAAGGVILAPLYADFAGGSGSAWRAAIMLIVVLGARALGRRTFSSRVVALSITSAWLVQPLVVFDYSFLLSLAATAGLCALARIGESHRPASNFPALDTLHRAGRTTLAATLPCLPVLLLISQGMSLTSIAGNLLAGPLGEIIALPLCLGHALLAPWPNIETGVAIVASGALTLILELSNACSDSQLLYFALPPPGRWHFAAAGLTAAGWLSVRIRPNPVPANLMLWLAIGSLAVLTVEWQVHQQFNSPPGRDSDSPRLEVTSLDVGQGDATWVQLPDGRTLLVDGGGFVGSPVDPGRLVLLPTARARRNNHIDIVALSHPHPDHFGGLLEFVKNISVGEFWFTGQGLHQGAGPRYAELIGTLKARGVPLWTTHKLCQRQRLQRANHRADPHIELLAPCPRFAEDQSANDNSLVLRITHGRHAALLAGDAEAWEEQQLLEAPGIALRADFLKVGHHGSRTSTSENWLQRVRPSVASISCGLRNRFGHPHTQTLSTLQAHGVRVLRLDHTGAVQWASDGRSQWLRTFQSQRARAWSTN